MTNGRDVLQAAGHLRMFQSSFVPRGRSNETYKIYNLGQVPKCQWINCAFDAAVHASDPLNAIYAY